jgi:hypothetical protein
VEPKGHGAIRKPLEPESLAAPYGHKLLTNNTIMAGEDERSAKAFEKRRCQFSNPRSLNVLDV